MFYLVLLFSVHDTICNNVVKLNKKIYSRNKDSFIVFVPCIGIYSDL